MSNPTDKELLTLAAKAAGIELLSEESEDWPTYYYYEIPGDRQGWNALNCDGDALRLAIKLSMTIDIGSAWVGVTYPMNCSELGSEHGGDVYAATRRAIVRAAAEMGRGME